MVRDIKKIAVISDTHLLAQAESVDIRPSETDDKFTRKQIKQILKTATKLENSVKNGEASEAHFILNGDIFEYVFPRIEPGEVTKQAVRFFIKLTKHFPHCHFHYLHGNHDHSLELNNQLTALQLPNLFMHKTHCQIGDALFTHGDILLGEHPKNELDIKPPRRLEDSSRFLMDHKSIKDHAAVRFLIQIGTTAGSFFKTAGNGVSNLTGTLFHRNDLMDQAAQSLNKKGMKKKTYRAKVSEFYTTLQKYIQSWVVENIRSPMRDAQIIAGTLAKEHPDILEAVNHVFTGHTHMPYAHLQLDHGIVQEDPEDAPNPLMKYSRTAFEEKIKLPHPIRFHNTGAPLIGAKMNVMMITMEDGIVKEIELNKKMNERIVPDETSEKYQQRLQKYADKVGEKWIKKNGPERNR